MTGPAQGREWCPGSGQPLEPVDQTWNRCPVCHWVAWPIRHTPTASVTAPRHQRPIPDPSRLF